ncbi:MAG TPA: hypothetical protein VH092_36575, partial [Urbifossiella sp.]|nr:hypothetical protein [Urbifossiella sp.]
MPIAVVCPGCSARLNTPDTAAGKTLKCPKCQTPVPVPAPKPPAAGAGGAPVPPKKAGRPAGPERDAADRPRRSRPADGDYDTDEPDDRPRRKGKKR